MHPFTSYLQSRLRKPLPGTAAQSIMAPVPHNDKHPEVSIPIDASQNAVLILFSKAGQNSLNVLYTLRSNRLMSHKGQISFPGGRAEKGEEPEDTALREAQEEVGIDPRKVSVLGGLSPLYVPPSNNVINPVAGYLETLPELRLQETEVAEAFTITLDELASDNALHHETWQLRGQDFRVPYWNVHATPLWGATAMITSEVVVLYREFLKQREG